MANSRFNPDRLLDSFVHDDVIFRRFITSIHTNNEDEIVQAPVQLRKSESPRAYRCKPFREMQSFLSIKFQGNPI